jgi:hypothetical protein
MRDIVERLRSPDFMGDECNDLLGEAAGEIERLRERIKEAEALRGGERRAMESPMTIECSHEG